MFVDCVELIFWLMQCSDKLLRPHQNLDVGNLRYRLNYALGFWPGPFKIALSLGEAHFNA